MKQLSLLNKILFGLNLLGAALLLFSYGAGFIDPETTTVPSFLGLAYPFIVLGNLLFIIYWLVCSKKYYLLSLLTILIGWKNVSNTVQCNLSSSASEETQTVKLMSWNVRLFDLYNWSDNHNTRDKMFDVLQQQNCDIYCFQEFFHSDEKDYFPTLDTLVQFLPANNVHAQYNATVQQVHRFGIATFSRYPIVNKGVVNLPEGATGNNECIYTDLRIGKDTLRVYNMHLASIHFGYDDYDFIDKIGEVETAEQVRGSKQIIALLKKAFIQRSRQVRAVKQHINGSPHPVVVCADLNDSPVSYAYNNLVPGLHDAFVESGNGMGITYNGKFPAFRIDFILHSDDLNTWEFKALNHNYSDHYPLTCLIELPG